VSGDVTPWGLAASLILVAVAIVLSRWQGLRLERDMVVSVLRSLAQLLLVSAGLTLVVAEDAPLIWSWLWVAAILAFSAVTVSRRAPQLPHVLELAAAANGACLLVGLGVLFGLGVFPVEGRTVVPLAGMVVGNAMKSCVVAAQLIAETIAERRPDIEARLALGLPGHVAVKPVVRGVLRTAISPQIEQTKALGIVFLPGAMTGLILAGVDPVDAVLVQLALMYVILGGAVTSTVVMTLGAVRRLFTADHRLIAIDRSARDE
jgi:putative ABC transport system permease protein